jgi:ribosomal protein L13
MTKSAITKTTRAVKNGFQRPYFLLDASKLPIGRIATEAARILIGKNRADYAPDVDMGGMVVIINADKQFMSGQKMNRKVYFRYGRQLGSLKSRSYAEQVELDFRFPLYNAIKKMLPRNRHQDLRINNRVFIFQDENHTITFPLFDSYTSAALGVAKDSSKPKSTPKVDLKAKSEEPLDTNTEIETKVMPLVDTVAMESQVESPVVTSGVVAEDSKPKTTKKSSEGDDLTIIEGIGPKIAELLIDNGITTFAQVADASVEDLTKILNEGGAKFNAQVSTIPSWAEQSALARDGKMEELETLKTELNNGK